MAGPDEGVTAKGGASRASEAAESTVRRRFGEDEEIVQSELKPGPVREGEPRTAKHLGGQLRLESVMFLHRHSVKNPKPREHVQNMVHGGRRHRHDDETARNQKLRGRVGQTLERLRGNVLEDRQHRDHVEWALLETRVREMTGQESEALAGDGLGQ